MNYQQSEVVHAKRLLTVVPSFADLLEQYTHKIGTIGEADIRAIKNDDSDDVTISVKVTGILDLRAIDLIKKLYKFARRFRATHMTIDMGQQIKIIKLINTEHLSNSHLGYLPITFKIHNNVLGENNGKNNIYTIKKRKRFNY